MIKVIVTSLNPAKISAVEAAFREVFVGQEMQFEGVAVDNGVNDQPMSSNETLLGARNRVANARAHVDADYYVGIEAGVEHPFTFAWMVVASHDRYGESRSASVPLPPSVLDDLDSGKELGDIMDELFNQQNVKQKTGAIGMLTNELLTRSSVYHQALILALIPFINTTLFPADV